MKPADDTGAIGVRSRIRTSDDTDNFHRQGEEEGASEAQLHGFEAALVLAEEGNEAQDGDRHLNDADVIGQIRNGRGIAHLHAGPDVAQANEGDYASGNVIHSFSLG